ncbi:hypothetical protein D918_02318 [Trichuris suis]|nr:hypothetical protein D918_02318 [Trichuris suis]
MQDLFTVAVSFNGRFHWDYFLRTSIAPFLADSGTESVLRSTDGLLLFNGYLWNRAELDEKTKVEDVRCGCSQKQLTTMPRDYWVSKKGLIPV